MQRSHSQILQAIREQAKVSAYEARIIAGHASKVSNVIKAYAPEMSPFDYQAEYMDDYESRLLIYKKPRQIGASHMAAQKGYMRAVTLPHRQVLMLSLSLEDAKEKIGYALRLHEEIGREINAPRLDGPGSSMSIGFTNGSRIVCVYTPRGKAESDIVLDEFAHYLDPQKIWQAAMPIMIHNGSRMTVLSTPLHSLTFFEDIWSGKDDKYTKFKRVAIRWWDCPVHCRDVAGARKQIYSPEGDRLIETEDAIKQFGSATIEDIFDSMPLDQFETEFELKDMDDNTALLPMQLILDTTPQGEASIDTYSSLYELNANTKGKTLYAGYDVGRIKDAGELSVFVEEGGVLRERFVRTFFNTTFDEQEDFCHQVLSIPQIMHLTIDSTGMGHPVAEKLERRWGSKCIPIIFSGPQSAAMATTLKMYMEKGLVEFAWDRNRNAQMHAVKKKISESGAKVTFGAPRGRNNASYRNHAEAFWTRALGVHGHACVSALGKPRVRFM